MNIATLVMAAGESRRFGGCKLLSELNKKPLLQYALENAHSLNTRWLYCVTGAWHQHIASAMDNKILTPTTLAHNPDWQEGLGNSLAFGINQLPSECEGVLILLGDQWAILPQSLQRILDTFDSHSIVCALVEEHRTVPALFPKRFFAELGEYSGHHGARQLLRSGRHPVKTIALPEAKNDVDTRECLKLAAASLIH